MASRSSIASAISGLRSVHENRESRRGEDGDVGHTAIGLVEEVLQTAVDLEASDVHVEPLSDRVRVRVRCDGVLREVMSFSRDDLPSMSSTMKVLAEANVTEDFINRITADHYLFCGNGAHHNPERSVVEAMAKARLGVGRDAVGPPDGFAFWFSSSPLTDGLTDNRKAHMGMLRDLVTDLANEYDPTDRFASTFLDGGSATIEL